MQFKIVDFKKNGSTIMIEGEADVNYFNLRKFEAYQDKTSHGALQDFCRNSGLGFSSNITDTNDSMTWINPGDKGRVFVQDIINRSYVDDNSFLWGYVDFYYNMNFIDIEKQMKLDIANQGGILMTGAEDSQDDTEPKEEVQELYLTTDGSAQSANNYCESYKVVNQASKISLDKGYRNKVKYYDQLTFDFNIYVVESLTSDESDKIILKAKPQDDEYYNEHSISNYTGKVDTDNMHENFNYAPVQNKQNLDDIQKVGLVLTLPLPNFNLYKFQKIRVVITEKNATPSSPVGNSRLSGDWLIVDISFVLVKGEFKQVVNLIKRELDMSADELKGEDTAAQEEEEKASEAKSETASTDPVGDPNPEEVPTVEEAVPDEEEEEVVEEEPTPEFDFAMEFSNATEIDEYFQKLNHENFVSWFGSTVIGNVNGTPNKIDKDGWNTVWNSIQTIYGKDKVNFAEFLSMNAFLYMNTAYELGNYPQPESSSNNAIQYMFEENETDGVNKTVVELADDKNYVTRFSHLKFGTILSLADKDDDDLRNYIEYEILGQFEEKFVLIDGVSGTDRYIFPYGFSVEEDEEFRDSLYNFYDIDMAATRTPSTDSKEINNDLAGTFLSNMDFIKFVKRGLLGNPSYKNSELKQNPKTGLDENYPEYSYRQQQSFYNGNRTYYKRVLRYILDNEESMPDVVTRAIKDWKEFLGDSYGTSDSNLDTILTISSSSDWDSIMTNQDIQMADLGIIFKGPFGYKDAGDSVKRGENIHIIPDISKKDEEAIKKAMNNLPFMVSNNSTYTGKFSQLVDIQVSALQGDSGEEKMESEELDKPSSQTTSASNQTTGGNWEW
jgi:hypothetical protein